MTQVKQHIPEKQRLAKALQNAGVASRRACEQIIEDGKVSVNQQKVNSVVHFVDPQFDKVEIDGKAVNINQELQQKFYFAVNKPTGYICSNTPTTPGMGRLVVDLLDKWLANWEQQQQEDDQNTRFFTVGRLDVNTSGLIFVTNDGDWANKIIHPRYDITKEYLVQLTEKVTKKQFQKIFDGFYEENGEALLPEFVGYAAPGNRAMYHVLRIVVTQGKNREVRRLVENAGLEVFKLRRVRIGAYYMPADLRIGKILELKEDDLKLITNKEIQNNIMKKMF